MDNKLEGKIKLTNGTSHKHYPRIFDPQTGRGFHRELAPKNSIYLTEEQFLEMYNTSNALGTILTYETKNMSATLLEYLGYENVKDLEEDKGILLYDSNKIKKIIDRGTKEEYNSFLDALEEIEESQRVDYYKRVFDVVKSLANKLSRVKAKELEEVLGMSIEIDEAYKGEKEPEKKATRGRKKK